MSQSQFVSKPETTQFLSGTTFGTLDIDNYSDFNIVTTGAATATLPAGKFNGQEITIFLRTDAGDLVVSGDFQLALVTATLGDAGDFLSLRWHPSAGWVTVSNVGAVLA